MLPSVRTLMLLTHNVNERDKAKAIRATLETAMKPYDKLHVVDALMGGHGVEGMPYWPGCSKRAFDYVNTGDTYNTTLIYDYGWRFGRGQFRVTTYGDEVERHERRCARCRKYMRGPS
jgi:hypothetical protein